MEVWFYIAVIWAVLALVCFGSWIYGLLPKRHKKRMNDKGESVWDQTEFCPTQPLRAEIEEKVVVPPCFQNAWTDEEAGRIRL